MRIECNIGEYFTSFIKKYFLLTIYSDLLIGEPI